MELPNWYLGQPRLTSLLSFILGQRTAIIHMLAEAEECIHWQIIRLLWHGEPAGDKAHRSGNLSLGFYTYSYIITNRNREDQQREPEFKKKITAFK